MKDYIRMERVEKFLQSRKSPNTHEYILAIIEYLNSKEIVPGQELREALVPRLIPRESYFFRILKDLEKEHFIRKITDETSRRGGRRPVSYKLIVPAMYFDDKRNIARRYVELTIAKKIIRERLQIDPDEAIAERFNKEYGGEVRLLTKVGKSDFNKFIKSYNLNRVIERLPSSLKADNIEIFEDAFGTHIADIKSGTRTLISIPLNYDQREHEIKQISQKADQHIKSLTTAAKEMSKSDSRRKPLGLTPPPRKMEFTPAGQKETFESSDEHVKSNRKNKSQKIEKTA